MEKPYFYENNEQIYHKDKVCIFFLCYFFIYLRERETSYYILHLRKGEEEELKQCFLRMRVIYKGLLSFFFFFKIAGFLFWNTFFFQFYKRNDVCEPVTGKCGFRGLPPK